jgi:hypothetical protein
VIHRHENRGGVGNFTTAIRYGWRRPCPKSKRARSGTTFERRRAASDRICRGRFAFRQTGKEIGRFLRPNDGLGLYVTIDAAREAFYCWINGTLSKFDLDGNGLWYRDAEPERKVLIDATEDVFWFGDMVPGAGQHPIAVASDAIYLAGMYANHYASTKTGVTLPPPTQTMYVGRYDLDGNRVWFQELVVDSAAPLVPVDFLGIVLDPMENPIVAVSSANRADGGFLFKLDQTDGSLL